MSLHRSNVAKTAPLLHKAWDESEGCSPDKVCPAPVRPRSANWLAAREAAFLVWKAYGNQIRVSG